MPCSKPLNAWQSPTPKSNGKKRIAFKQEHIGLEALPLQIPCGQCWSCRLERSRQWALRCVHEASLHPDNMFLTLTYNEESLPADGGLDKTHFQKFMKRYRQHLERNEGGQKIRYYMCGEYGDQTNRPHYHALIFGHNFSDKTLFRKTDSGHNLYTSTILDNLWTHGFCNIGELTFESAAYTARYIMKKVNDQLSISAMRSALKNGKRIRASIPIRERLTMYFKNIQTCPDDQASVKDGMQNMAKKHTATTTS